MVNNAGHFDSCFMEEKEKGHEMMWLKIEIGIIVGGMLFSGFDYNLSSGEV